MIRVHTANQRDINGMFEVDLRAYEYPIGYIEIKDYLMSRECFCVIAADDSHNVVGYAIFKKDAAAGVLEIVRLGVLPKRRGEGAGKELLRAGSDFCLTYNLHEMSVLVPEIKCNPGQPDDVSRWLRYQDFLAVLPIKKDEFEMYGSKVDGIKFVRKINVAPTIC